MILEPRVTGPTDLGDSPGNARLRRERREVERRTPTTHVQRFLNQPTSAAFQVFITEVSV